MILRRNYQNQSQLPQHTHIPPHNNPIPIGPIPSVDASMQEYELLLQFDLKRERQKNMILEQRLKNKQNFIQQMKHFQQELTGAYEQCKNQLVLAQQKIEYLQNVQFREYTEQISDLKHMMMLQTQPSKRYSVGREEKQTYNHSSISRTHKNQSDKGIIAKNSNRRPSKTHSFYATQRQKSPGDKFQLQVGKQIKKTANFLSHFLQMAQCYMIELKSEVKLTKKLKKSWKWIKDVVKEWDNLSDQSKEYTRFRRSLTQLTETDRNIDLNDLFEAIRRKMSNK